jgi:hypothetical protein
MREIRESRLNPVSSDAGDRADEQIDYAAVAAAGLDAILAAAYDARQDELVRILASVRRLILALSPARG